ncbi:MAG: sensor histidine kinase [bacterium]
MNIRYRIFLEMKNYSLSFKDKRFQMKIVTKDKKQKYYTLYENGNNLFILAPYASQEKKEYITIVTPVGPVLVPNQDRDIKALKIMYPKANYSLQISKMEHHLFWKFLFFAFGVVFLSLFAAWYMLKPLRNSLHMLEEFIRDIIHDLNTPLSAILINLKMIDIKNEEIESIRISAQTIEMLHYNLDTYIEEGEHSKEAFSLKEVVDKYVALFSPLYEYLCWNIKVEDCVLFTDKQAFERIIYNLISNACKYNRENGFIEIVTNKTVLTLRNSSYGIKNPNRVFERFYKESNRGLGIGLHIVDKLCNNLKIGKQLYVNGSDVIVLLECKDVIRRNPNFS